MLLRLRYDSEADMWGFKEGETLQNVHYMGEPLSSKYKKEELWLRSDLSRLLTLFKVAIPTNVALEEANEELDKLNFERRRLQKVN